VDIAETEGISLRTSLISLNGENAEFIESLLELAVGRSKPDRLLV
jgi:hypothetical protein